MSCCSHSIKNTLNSCRQATIKHCVKQQHIVCFRCPGWVVGAAVFGKMRSQKTNLLRRDEHREDKEKHGYDNYLYTSLWYRYIDLFWCPVHSLCHLSHCSLMSDSIFSHQFWPWLAYYLSIWDYLFILSLHSDLSSLSLAASLSVSWPGPMAAALWLVLKSFHHPLPCPFVKGWQSEPRWHLWLATEPRGEMDRLGCRSVMRRFTPLCDVNNFTHW